MIPLAAVRAAFLLPDRIGALSDLSFHLYRLHSGFSLALEAVLRRIKA
jgi:hypothetical protein